MNPRTASTLLLSLAVAIGALLPRLALATPSLDACTGVLHRTAGTTDTISVNAPGTWCLDQDLLEDVDVVGGSFVVVTVEANDVTIDCRGHRIEYAGTADSARGVATYGMRAGVTVRNCRFSGFTHAVYVFGDGFLVEDNVVRASVTSPYGNEDAIFGYGNGIVRRNRIHDSIRQAILAKGSSQVLDNLIDGVADNLSSPRATGVEITQSTGAVVRGNTVRGLVSSAPNQVMALNINNAASGDPRNVVTDNVLVGDGVDGHVGIFCDSAARVNDNVVTGFFAPIVGFCVDTGDNDFSP